MDTRTIQTLYLIWSFLNSVSNLMHDLVDKSSGATDSGGFVSLSTVAKGIITVLGNYAREPCISQF